MEEAIFLSEPERLSLLRPEFGRLYFGNEFCHWRLPSAAELKSVRETAESRQIAFTFVTPILDQVGLSRTLKLLEGLEPRGEPEVVVNDFGLLEMLVRERWEGTIVCGRLLTRQQRGAGWNNPSQAGKADARHLRGSALDSPRLVEWLSTRYGVRRFEIDNLVQGVEERPPPPEIHLSVYHPFVFLTTTRLCPWSFDGRRWKNPEGCASPCRSRILVLDQKANGRPILMGGSSQFLKNDARTEVYSGPGVDRRVYQPVIPT